MRKLGILLVIVGVVFAFTMPAMATNASIGKWEVTFEGPMGPETWKMDLKADGTATGEHPMFGPVDKAINNSEGDKFDVTMEVDSPMGRIIMTFVGKISGSSAKGKVNMMDSFVEWTGVKK